ncbi:unnamed protein product [Amoebophrya sp. A25]|nr:unnamed protein product [Amoebophrya sp. A25]|eukprot:GSA25T00001634001.1
MTDNKVFVGNVPHYVPEEYLKNKFGEHGNVRDMYYCPDLLGADRGWATITYMSPEEAATAVGIEHGMPDPFPGCERPLHVKFFNTPLTERAGSVFDLRPKTQKVLTPWVGMKDEGTGNMYYVNELTEETTWERPAEMDQVVVNPSGANVLVGDVGLMDNDGDDDGAAPLVVGCTDTGPMGANLFIHGNLGGVSDKMLYEVFVGYGELVGCKIHVANEFGGFGYVSYRTCEECTNALRELNLTDAFGTGTTIKIMLKKGEEMANPEAAALVEKAMVSGMRESHGKAALGL